MGLIAIHNVMGEFFFTDVPTDGFWRNTVYGDFDVLSCSVPSAGFGASVSCPDDTIQGTHKEWLDIDIPAVETAQGLAVHDQDCLHPVAWGEPEQNLAVHQSLVDPR